MVVFNKHRFQESIKALKNTINIDPSTVQLRPQEGSLIYNLPRCKLKSEMSPEELEYNELLHNPQNILHRLEMEYCIKKMSRKTSPEELKQLEGKINQAIYYNNLTAYYSDSDSSCDGSEYSDSSENYSESEGSSECGQNKEEILELNNTNEEHEFDLFSDIQNNKKNNKDSDDGFTMVMRK